MNRFDFVFLLRLRKVRNNSALAELLVAQHGKLEKDDIQVIDVILRGKTELKVLLIFDGYDEYKPGTNTQIDKAIDHTIGNCFLILTSRPELPFHDGYFLPKEIRDKMYSEILIQGFCPDKIKTCCVQYFKSDEKSETMLLQAEKAGIGTLLKVPVVLLMVCVLFSEHESLPKTRTNIVDKIFGLTINRTALKALSREQYADFKQGFHDFLCALGQLSWTALKLNLAHLPVNKVCFLCLISYPLFLETIIN